MEFHNKTIWDVSKHDLFSRCVQLTRFIMFMAGSAIFVLFCQSAVEWLYLPGVKDWMQCDDTALISKGLQPILLDSNTSYGCTTKGVSRSLPCMCCVHGHCWRDAKIEKNSTAMGTMWDSMANGRKFKRRLPRYIIVSYKNLGDTGEYIRQEKDEAVGDVFRAIEMLHNLPPAGEETTDEL